MKRDSYMSDEQMYQVVFTAKELTFLKDVVLTFEPGDMDEKVVVDSIGEKLENDHIVLDPE
jgi:hypothetical protein